jgi:tetratricopeptide (TPR) repeat protein
MSESEDLAGGSSGDPLPDVFPQPPKQSQLDFDIEFYNSILLRSPDYVDVLRCQGELLSRKGRHAEALEVDRRLARLLPHDAVVQYNLACSLEQNALRDDALAALRRAFERGYDDFEHIDLDADLEVLRNDPRYVALVAEFRPSEPPPRRAKKSRNK